VSAFTDIKKRSPAIEFVDKKPDQTTRVAAGISSPTAQASLDRGFAIGHLRERTLVKQLYGSGEILGVPCVDSGWLDRATFPAAPRSQKLPRKRIRSDGVIQVSRNRTIEPHRCTQDTPGSFHSANPLKHSVRARARANVPKLIDRLGFVEHKHQSIQTHCAKKARNRFDASQRSFPFRWTIRPTEVRSI
jgi:hypothetical protein